jgi:acylphosphatase
MTVEARHILVSGDVQGVGYRAWTERVARELGLKGWVRNLADGRVEIVAEGPRVALDQLIERCKQGPRAASVENVSVESSASSGAQTFAVLRTAPKPTTSS